MAARTAAPKSPPTRPREVVGEVAAPVAASMMPLSLFSTPCVIRLPQPHGLRLKQPVVRSPGMPEAEGAAAAIRRNGAGPVRARPGGLPIPTADVLSAWSAQLLCE